MVAGGPELGCMIKTKFRTGRGEIEGRTEEGEPPAEGTRSSYREIAVQSRDTRGLE